MTPSDIKVFCNIDDLTFNPCTVDHVFQEELELARNCIGLELWESMISAKADYSDIDEYVSSTSYDVDDVVLYRGEYKIALVATDKEPSYISDWSAAPRFEGDCASVYDELYCNYLGPFIANKVLAKRLPFIRTKIAGFGTVESKSNYHENTSDKRFNSMVVAVETAAQTALNNLKWFMALDEQVALKDTCLNGWPLYETECKPKNKQFLHRAGNYDFG